MRIIIIPIITVCVVIIPITNIFVIITIIIVSRNNLYENTHSYSSSLRKSIINYSKYSESQTPMIWVIIRSNTFIINRNRYLTKWTSEQLIDVNTFKYHVSFTDGKFSVKIIYVYYQFFHHSPTVALTTKGLQEIKHN